MKKLLVMLTVFGFGSVLDLAALYHPQNIDGEYNDDQERDAKKARRHANRRMREQRSDAPVCTSCQLCTSCPGGVQW